MESGRELSAEPAPGLGEWGAAVAEGRREALGLGGPVLGQGPGVAAVERPGGPWVAEPARSGQASL